MKTLTKILKRKVGEDVTILWEYNAESIGWVFKIYFEESNQVAIIEERDLGVNIDEDYEFEDLLESFMRELKKTNSILFI